MEYRFLKVTENMNASEVYRQLNLYTGKLSHAYIAGGGTSDTLAAAAVCSGQGGSKPCMACPGCSKASRGIHPDITIVDRQTDKREIVVEQIRRLKKDVIIVPTESEKKVYIIKNADLMNISAQNAFLRILEEPPGYAVFILQTETPAALLPTVRSRCVELKIGLESEGSDPDSLEIANELFSALGNDNLRLAGMMFRLEKLDKDAFGRFLATAAEQALMRLRAGAENASGTPRETIAHLERTLCKAKDMLDMNVNAGHIAGLICAAIIKELQSAVTS